MSRFLSLYGVRGARRVGARKVPRGRLVKLLPTQNSFRASSERRCGANHAHKRVADASLVRGKLEMILWRCRQVPSKYTSKTVYQLIETARHSPPRGGANRAHEFGVASRVFFTCAHPGKRIGPRSNSTQVNSTRKSTQLKSNSYPRNLRTNTYKF